MSIDTTPVVPEVLARGPVPELEAPEQADFSPTTNVEQDQKWQRVRNAGHRLGKTVATALFVATPVAAAVIGIEAAPPAHVELAGQDATIEPDISKNYTTIDGILNRQDHVGGHGLEMGATINANILRLLFPQNAKDKAAVSQLVQDPKPEIDRLQDAARNQVLLWGGAAFALTSLLEAGYLFTRHQQQRKFNAGSPEYQKHVAEHDKSRNRREAVVAVGAMVAVLGVAGHIIEHQDHHTVRPSAIFSGTPFAGTEELSGAVDKIGPMVRAQYSPEQAKFYDTVSANLIDTAQNTPGLAERKPGTSRILIGDDIQFVQGMARILGSSAKTFDVDGTFYLGDWTDTDSDIESFILDTFLYYSDGRDMLSMAGLHDTSAILEAEASRDNIMLAENKVIDYKDLRVLALNDPRVSTINHLGMLYGNPYNLRDSNVSIEDFTASAIDKICNEKPQFMTLHDNKLGKLILKGAQEQGCDTPITFDGRSFTPLGLQEYHSSLGSKTALEYTTGSAGGHRDTGFSTGIIKDAAFEAVADIDPDAGTITIYPITIGKDAAVTVSDPITRSWQQPEALQNNASHPGHVSALAADKNNHAGSEE